MKKTLNILQNHDSYFMGKFRGNTRGNLECGSAQPGLFSNILILIDY
jgi:hypothetical protein